MSLKINNALFQDLSDLRAKVTDRSIDLLRAEDFPRAQALAQVSQELKQVEAKLVEVLGDTAGGSGDAPEPEAFPKYLRESASVLVKIGLRRDGEATYEQKVTRSEFEEIIAVLRDLRTKRNQEFEASDLIQRVSFPLYKTYLVMGLLQERGHLESPRRGRYRFRGEADGWASGLWDAVERASLVPFTVRGRFGKARGSA
ncbi:MAG: hypothetical protein ABR576_05775 [Thermoanaerobaculia bacterium]